MFTFKGDASGYIESFIQSENRFADFLFFIFKRLQTMNFCKLSRVTLYYLPSMVKIRRRVASPTRLAEGPLRFPHPGLEFFQFAAARVRARSRATVLLIPSGSRGGAGVKWWERGGQR